MDRVEFYLDDVRSGTRSWPRTACVDDQDEQLGHAGGQPGRGEGHPRHYQHGRTVGAEEYIVREIRVENYKKADGRPGSAGWS